jgi:hypothetical protein
MGEDRMQNCVRATMSPAIGTAVVGNVLEWYDFIVYSYLATIIAANFFAPGNKIAALLDSFEVFGIGFWPGPSARVRSVGSATRWGAGTQTPVARPFVGEPEEVAPECWPQRPPSRRSCSGPECLCHCRRAALRNQRRPQPITGYSVSHSTSDQIRDP